MQLCAAWSAKRTPGPRCADASSLDVPVGETIIPALAGIEIEGCGLQAACNTGGHARLARPVQLELRSAVRRSPCCMAVRKNSWTQ
jgi:hypothetical protein